MLLTLPGAPPGRGSSRSAERSGVGLEPWGGSGLAGDWRSSRSAEQGFALLCLRSRPWRVAVCGGGSSRSVGRVGAPVWRPDRRGPSPVRVFRPKCWACGQRADGDRVWAAFMLWRIRRRDSANFFVSTGWRCECAAQGRIPPRRRFVPPQAGSPRPEAFPRSYRRCPQVIHICLWITLCWLGWAGSKVGSIARPFSGGRWRGPYGGAPP